LTYLIPDNYPIGRNHDGSIVDGNDTGYTLDHEFVGKCQRLGQAADIPLVISQGHNKSTESQEQTDCGTTCESAMASKSKDMQPSMQVMRRTRSEGKMRERG